MPIKKLGLRLLLPLAVAAALNASSWAASVGASGYTNAFSTQPAAADWSTATVTGGAADVTTAAGLDAAVAALTAAGITTQVAADAVNPPGAQGLATWCSSGLYLQTRPTSVKCAVLMATLVNNTGASANDVTISYVFGTNSPPGLLQPDGCGQ